METLLIIGGILVVLGIVGSIIPAFPGPALSFIGLLLLFFSKGAEIVPVSMLVVFGIGILILTLIDYAAPILGAKFFGASRRGTMGAIIGAILGIIFLPPLGIFIGSFLGAVIGEILTGKKIEKALRAGVGSLFGSFFVILLQITFTLIIAIYYFWKIF